ncbi:uncharacterized protein LOC127872172 [Dreissena polymorpha]|uniref:uncharacterized protein LOC127872172 n=1 Tax=Dreissena polymorpha TaxID=45954 RepID=UPI0022650E79|nr:uncharacterized protein LOC127872172 [Dreissena polymorpha]
MSNLYTTQFVYTDFNYIMDLNGEQIDALNKVTNGHNVLILGSAGTGKTHLIKQIEKSLKKNNKNVAITATTGIASALYANAMTIHKWSGIGDGRYNTGEVKSVVEHYAEFAIVRDRLKTTDVLIIDECSMLSKKFFESLDQVCQIRNPDKLFGGIQLVLSGDFKQLPPVPNPLYAEEGEFCFQSELFTKVIPHRIILREVVRQSEPHLIKAIKEAADGEMSIDSINFIKTLERPLTDASDCVKLFSRNEKVDQHNRDCILEYPGELYEFKSHDDGDRHFLEKMIAPKILWLKIGSPVMLLKNISDKLVNGLQGHVHSITDMGPVIEFTSLQTKLQLEKHRFAVFSPSKNAEVAVRTQYPVNLSFSMTIHKSQGLTLNRLEVDCHQIFKPGQLGVALGRAKSSEGLRVINFDPTCHVISQPEVVQLFMNQPSILEHEDLSCCRPGLKGNTQEPNPPGIYTLQDMQLIQESIDNVEMNENFRKDLLESFNIKKKMAHRKQVRVSETGIHDKKTTRKGKAPAVKKAQLKKDEQHVEEISSEEEYKLTVLLESANPSKPRDIIVKLTSYRAKLYLRRSKLKDVGYKSTFINEDLTSKRSSLLFNARALVKSGRLLGAWSSDGTILIKDSKSKIHRVSNNDYLTSFRSDDSNR